MIGQQNALLTKIERAAGTVAGGTHEDYDRPATSGTTPASDDLWTGKAGVYWLERRRRVSNGQDSDVILERSVVIGTRPEVDFIENDVVTVEHAGQTKTGRVAVIEKRAMPGVGPSVRLTLEDA